MKFKISILGSTGSIGISTLKIIDKRKKNFNINFLSANKNYLTISKQIKKYKPKFFIITDEKIYMKVKRRIIIIINLLKGFILILRSSKKPIVNTEQLIKI